MKLLFNILFTLGLMCSHSAGAAGGEEEARDAGSVVRIRNLGLERDAIINVVHKKKCLRRGISRVDSINIVYSQLIRGYRDTRENDTNRIGRLLNLATLIHDRGFTDAGPYFGTIRSLYDYVCDKLAWWRERPEVSGKIKTQLAFREAHLCLERWRNTEEDGLLERAYYLFGRPFDTTRNKYGLPWQAEIIVHNGYKAGYSTREEALGAAREILLLYANPRDAHARGLAELIVGEIGGPIPIPEARAEAHRVVAPRGPVRDTRDAVPFPPRLDMRHSRGRAEDLGVTIDSTTTASAAPVWGEDDGDMVPADMGDVDESEALFGEHYAVDAGAAAAASAEPEAEEGAMDVIDIEEDGFPEADEEASLIAGIREYAMDFPGKSANAIAAEPGLPRGLVAMALTN